MSNKLFPLTFLLIVFAFSSCQNGTDSQIKATQVKLDSITNKMVMDSIRHENELLKKEIAVKNKEEKPLPDLYEALKKSVFLVKVKTRNSEGIGTAFLISEEGYCLTNYHVLENASDAYLLDHLGNRHEITKIINKNSDLDYVFFKIDNFNNLPSINVAQTNPAIGDKTFAIGNPMGLEQTLSEGIVSGFRAQKNVIQTTTEINRGSSGGPLFNRQGKAIGITTAMLNTQGNLNFAVNIQSLDLSIKAREKQTLSGGTETAIPIVIRTFIQAEDQKDFGTLFACFDNRIEKYWDIDFPTRNQLSRRYADIWKKIDNPKNNIRSVKTLGNNRYLCTIDFSFYSIKDNHSKQKKNTKVLFELNDLGDKIIGVQGK